MAKTSTENVFNVKNLARNAESANRERRIANGHPKLMDKQLMLTNKKLSTLLPSSAPSVTLTISTQNMWMTSQMCKPTYKTTCK